MARCAFVLDAGIVNKPLDDSLRGHPENVVTCGAEALTPMYLRVSGRVVAYLCPAHEYVANA